MIDWDRSVLICLGPGGVGKTTISAAAGIAGALAGERVMVLTIDPAQRLADTLGLARTSGHGLGGGTGLGNEPQLVSGPWPGELWAAMLDPAETLADIIRRHGSPGQARRVLGNPLFTTIAESLSGINEYMAAERLHEFAGDPRFDRVIIDTPPSRHAVDFLNSPERLTRFFDNRFYRSVLAPRRGLIRSFNAAAQIVVRLTAKLVGAALVDDVVRLFADLEGLDKGFRQRAVEVSDLLHGPDCSYTLITTARREPIREARWIRNSLERRGTTVDTFVVNRLAPWGHQPEPPPITKGRKADRAALEENLEQLRRLGQAEGELIDELNRSRRAGVTAQTVRIEERTGPVRTIDDLVELATALRPEL